MREKLDRQPQFGAFAPNPSSPVSNLQIQAGRPKTALLLGKVSPCGASSFLYIPDLQ